MHSEIRISLKQYCWVSNLSAGEAKRTKAEEEVARCGDYCRKRHTHAEKILQYKPSEDSSSASRRYAKVMSHRPNVARCHSTHPCHVNSSCRRPSCSRSECDYHPHECCKFQCVMSNCNELDRHSRTPELDTVSDV